MQRIAAFLLASVVAWPAQAQVQNYIVPTAPHGTSDKRAASTEFVLQALSFPPVFTQVVIDPVPSSLGTGLIINQTAHGTGSSLHLNQINVNSDDMDGGSTPSNGALLIGHDFGGSNLKGGRQTLAVQAVLTNPSSAVNPLPEYVAGSFLALATSSDGGTATDILSHTKGAMFGFNAITALYSGATNFTAAGSEIALDVRAGASAYYNNVLALSTAPTHAVKGSYYDTMLAISSQGGVGSDNGILFGPMHGGNPLATTGSMIAWTNKDRSGSGTVAATVANFADLSQVTISTCTIKLIFGCVIDGGGAITAPSVNVTPAAGQNHGLLVTQTGAVAAPTSGDFYYNRIKASLDVAQVTGVGGVTDTLRVAMGTGGVVAQGTKRAIGAYASLDDATGASGLQGDIVAVSMAGSSTVNGGGTNTGAGALGNIYGGNCNGWIHNGATNMSIVSCMEVQANIDAGASAKHRWGMSIVGNGDLQGAVSDTALEFSAATANGRWQNLISLDNYHGQAPTTNTGCFVCSADGSANTMANFVDLHTFTFTSIFNFANFSVSGAGFIDGAALSIGTTSNPGAGLIYINSASFLMRNKTSWTNGAAGFTATLTNAPAVGNPTKWIPIDDNGTTRYLPAW